jgi:hypothetical protein
MLNRTFQEKSEQVAETWCYDSWDNTTILSGGKKAMGDFFNVEKPPSPFDFEQKQHNSLNKDKSQAHRINHRGRKIFSRTFRLDC